MRTNLTKITLAVGFMLALVFTFSCSEKCGDKKYNPETQFCYDNSDIIDKCGGKEYNSATQFCLRENIFDKCGDSEYDHEMQFCDSRDNKTYKYVKIGEQVWMAENLSYNDGGKCYDNKKENCQKYGRLYTWATAKYVCPNGWRLPSIDEWQVLVDVAGGNNEAGKNLKAANGWDDYKEKSGNGEDKFGFSALPGGLGSSGGDYFYNVGYSGRWWSSSELRGNGWSRSCGYSRRIGYYNERYDYEGSYKDCYDDKDYLFSVRCVRD